MSEKAHLRKSTEAQRLTLKASFDTAVDACGGPTSFQHETRVVVGQLSKYASPFEPLFPPIDVVLDADLKARKPVVLQALALAEGYELMPLAATASTLSWAEEMGALAQDQGELLARIGDAAADEVDAHEARACLDEAFKTRAQLEEIISRLSAIADGKAGG